MVSRRLRSRRRGMGTVEWIVVAGAVLLACVLLVALMGRRVNTQLGNTAQEVADPASLTQRFSN